MRSAESLNEALSGLKVSIRTSEAKWRLIGPHNALQCLSIAPHNAGDAVALVVLVVAAVGDAAIFAACFVVNVIGSLTV